MIVFKKHNVNKSHIKCSINSGVTTTSQNNVRVGVLGASGYTGSEVSYILSYTTHLRTHLQLVNLGHHIRH
jgi:N-acetyl-gamma-glutamyl-phosphate reductase